MKLTAHYSACVLCAFVCGFLFYRRANWTKRDKRTKYDSKADIKNTNRNEIGAASPSYQMTKDLKQKLHGTLILIRHGQSTWNRKPNHPDQVWRYAGSVDVPLSEVGIQEAFEAGIILEFTSIDVIFSSEMDRAKSTVGVLLSCHSSKKIPLVEKSCPLQSPRFEGVHAENPQDFIIPMYLSSQLNERHFGNLQGVPSNLHTKLFDENSIRKMRNEYHLKFPGKSGESCCDVYNRAIPYFKTYILPHLKAGKSVLVSSHGFVIRSLIKFLDGMTDDEFNFQMKLEKTDPRNCSLLAPTGVPLVYKYVDDSFKKVKQSAHDRVNSLNRSSAPY